MKQKFMDASILNETGRMTKNVNKCTKMKKI